MNTKTFVPFPFNIVVDPIIVRTKGVANFVLVIFVFFQLFLSLTDFEEAGKKERIDSFIIEIGVRFFWFSPSFRLTLWRTAL